MTKFVEDSSTARTSLCLTDSGDLEQQRIVEIGHAPIEDLDEAVNVACKKIETAFTQWEDLNYESVDAFLEHRSKWFVLYGNANIKEIIDIIEGISQIEHPMVQQVFTDNDIVFKVRTHGTS